MDKLLRNVFTNCLYGLRERGYKVKLVPNYNKYYEENRKLLFTIDKTQFKKFVFCLYINDSGDVVINIKPDYGTYFTHYINRVIELNLQKTGFIYDSVLKWLKDIEKHYKWIYYAYYKHNDILLFPQSRLKLSKFYKSKPSM